MIIVGDAYITTNSYGDYMATEDIPMTLMFLCRKKKDEVYTMTSLLCLKTTNSTGPKRPSQRQDIPRMHFTGVNMLILAQQPMAAQESCSRYGQGWIELRTRTVYVQ